MSFRLFEGVEHANIYRLFRYPPPKTIINRIVNFLKEKYNGKLEQVVDLGCGTGQCTLLLSSHFENVLGTDISEAQIDQAKALLGENKIQNVIYKVSAAERIPFKDKSVQLITACTAAHWFDLPKVYEEGRRVLCPDGVMAFLSVEGPSFLFTQDPSKNAAIEELMKWVFGNLDKHRASPVQLVIDKYKDVTIPYSDLTREYGFTEDREVSVFTILGIIRSFSAFQIYCKNKGYDAGSDLLNEIKTRFVSISGIAKEDCDKNLFINREPYFLVMARI